MAETAPPKKRVGPLTFLKQVNQEARKVTWPKRNETLTATVMVLIMVVVAAIFFAITDFVVRFAVAFLTGIGQTGGGQ